MRSGFVSIIGKTNAGKSTMINSLLGEELCFVSHKENATRRNMNVVVMHNDNQIILVDTPGLHESNKTFNQLLIEAAKKSIENCDVILYVMSIYDSLEEYKKFLDLNPKVKHIVVLNKIDLISSEKLLKKLEEFNKLKTVPIVFPYTSKNSFYKKALLDEISKNLPEHPYFYDPDYSTDKSVKDIARELILESIYKNLSDELPYCCEVEVQKVIEGSKFYTFIADIVTDNASHKAMIIGKEGMAIKRIGINARKRLADLLGCKVNIELYVKVNKNWYHNDDFLKRNGLKQG